MTTQNFPAIDYDYRPASYWDTRVDPLQAILANVKGTQRRQMIRDYWESGRLEELAESHLLDCLNDEQRQQLGLIHPVFMGGEYLPDYEKGAIEIARIELESTTADVISVRAAPKSSSIVYSVVDEYGSEFAVSPTSSEKPLTLAELIHLIDAAGEDGSLGICFTIMNYKMDEPTIEALNELRSFTRVDSEIYSQLSTHYKNVTDVWYKEERRKVIELPQEQEQPDLQ